MSKPFAERRKAPRVQGDFFLQLHGPESDASVRVKDISTSGVCCIAPAALPELSRVHMEIRLPHDSHKNGKPVTANGAVVRCEPQASGFDVAIFFLEISEESRSAIARYVESSLSRASALPKN
ncbi:MAG: PilZ domain-containing protein [Planctomycetes bacterium]|nr:PilZ domain-containing protein [Planctomycetota bacterium]MBI3845120.1 PilZ domain-containing protein [Planctomycetota bacterium]